MKFKLLIILILILGYTYPSGAQDYSSFGKSIYSSKISTYKSSQKIHRPERIKQESKWEGTATFTLKEGKFPLPNGTPTDSISRRVTGTLTLKPWLGESLYKRQYKKDEKHKNQYYPFSEKERNSGYSNIFYQGKREKQAD